MSLLLCAQITLSAMFGKPAPAASSTQSKKSESSVASRRAAMALEGAGVLFSHFCGLCKDLERRSGEGVVKEKQNLIKGVLSKFKNPLLLLTMLMPKQEKRVYSLKDKSIAKHLAALLRMAEVPPAMTLHNFFFTA